MRWQRDHPEVVGWRPVDGSAVGSADLAGQRLERVLAAPGVYGLGPAALSGAVPSDAVPSDGLSAGGVAAGVPGAAADEPPLDVEAARGALAAFDPGRRGLKALAVVAAVVALAVGFLVWRSRPHPVEVAPATARSGAPLTASPPAPAGIVVAVAGRVHRPGLVRLPVGARVADAIEAAGGVLPDTDLGFLNLARKLIDGELLVIGASPAPPAGGAGSAAAGQPGGLVNLNTATLAELDALPGVGPVLAQRIIDYRESHGGFRSVDELRRVDGVGDARFADLKDLVTV